MFISKSQFKSYITVVMGARCPTPYPIRCPPSLSISDPITK